VYFQGYFFSRPEILTTHEIPANRLNYIRMLKAVSKPELDANEIERLVKSDASICYRLLRYLNSAAFAFGSEIHSVKHGLSLLGERQVRRWVRLVATLGAAQQKSTELVLMALARARFCELLSPKVSHGDSDLFLLGLLSLIDVMLEVPMATLLEQVPVDQETKAVLLGGASRLRPLYQLLLARESGDWQAVKEFATQLKITETEVAEVYWEAMQWARQVNEG
jgi:c-di-GMP-related signal transduction protein